MKEYNFSGYLPFPLATCYEGLPFPSHISYWLFYSAMLIFGCFGIPIPKIIGMFFKTIKNKNNQPKKQQDFK